MQDTGAQAPAEALDEDDTRLAHLGYRPQLNRVLGLFGTSRLATRPDQPPGPPGHHAGPARAADLAEHHWGQGDGRVAQFGVYVEILGTFGVAVVLGIHGFHHGLGFLTSTLGAEHASANALGLNFGGSWLGAA